MRLLICLLIISSYGILPPVQAVASSEANLVNSFTAKKWETNEVQFSWKSAKEWNKGSFIIERSENGINFQTVDNIIGTESVADPMTYHYLDPEPTEGLNFYRLKYINESGSYTYSHVIAILIADKMN